MRTLIAIATGTLALSSAIPVAAQYAPREFDRGYHDCLAGRYDQDEYSHAYRQGCRAAEREREGDSAGGCPPGATEADRYRYPGCRGMDEGGPNRRPERIAPGGIPNVVGMEPVQALSAMASRGYRNVGTAQVGGVIVGIYYNPMTGECVHLANANNRVVAAQPVGSDPRCR